MISTRCVLSLAALACPSAVAQAGGGVHNNHQLRYTQAHGMTFSEIGDPGAPGISGQPAPGLPFQQIQSVEHRYRMSTTEVTTAQYFEFVEAVAPHIVALGGIASTLDGNSLQYLGMSGGVPRYQMLPGTENHPARTNFGYFAMMANWLHHGAPDVDDATIDDFRTGAYSDPVKQASRNEGARFWIPTRDEWVKAAYYDPNRHGPGEGGYWDFPDASNDPLIPGRPEDGGETSAGNFDEWPPPKGFPDDNPDNGRPQGVGLYPDVQTPWGLLDASGSAREWTETQSGSFTDRRIVEGTQAAVGLQPGTSLQGDLLFTFDVASGRLSSLPYIGVRFAAAIPSPSSAAVVGAFALVLARRRR